MFSLPSQVATNDSQQSNWKQTTGNNRFVPVRCSVLPVFIGQSQSIKFFAFFESSIMRKIGPGSRPGSRACCVSGRALSEGGFALNTRLVYFVSEQGFPSGAYFKSALPPYGQWP
jgi:hypothetical protein